MNKRGYNCGKLNYMRSLRGVIIGKKITSVEGFIKGNWYILYSGGERRLLFRFKGYICDEVYDSLCYSFVTNSYDNSGDLTFSYDGSEKYCVMAKGCEVREYFRE